MANRFILFMRLFCIYDQRRIRRSDFQERSPFIDDMTFLLHASALFQTKQAHCVQNKLRNSSHIFPVGYTLRNSWRKIMVEWANFSSSFFSSSQMERGRNGFLFFLLFLASLRWSTRRLFCYLCCRKFLWMLLASFNGFLCWFDSLGRHL